jgi:hypothetical protein
MILAKRLYLSQAGLLEALNTRLKQEPLVLLIMKQWAKKELWPEKMKQVMIRSLLSLI